MQENAAVPRISIDAACSITVVEDCLAQTSDGPILAAPPPSQQQTPRTRAAPEMRTAAVQTCPIARRDSLLVSLTRQLSSRVRSTVLRTNENGSSVRARSLTAGNINGSSSDTVAMMTIYYR